MKLLGKSSLYYRLNFKLRIRRVSQKVKKKDKTPKFGKMSAHDVEN